MKVKSESEVVQLYPTLRDPMDCNLPGSSIHGIFQASVLEWGAIVFLSGKFHGQRSLAGYILWDQKELQTYYTEAILSVSKFQ